MVGVRGWDEFMKNKAGRNVLVTGSSRGIGYGIARAFAQTGDNVMLNCIQDRAGMERAVEELQGISTGMISGIMSDVSDYGSCKSMFENFNRQFGQMDILVNNAGKGYFGLFQDMDENSIDEVIKSNLCSVMYPTHFALPIMLLQKSGVILNISSIWGVSGASCEAVYSAAKAGIIGFTKALAKELGPSGVRVNCIACGAFDTRMNDRLSAVEKEMFLSEIPLGRFGELHEAGELAVFLASEGAGYITGQAINLDGGYL